MKILIGITIGIFIFSSHARAGWMADGDFTSCDRRYLPTTKGSEGPFNSESACLARVREVERTQILSCAKYKCVSSGSGAADSTAAQPGHEMDPYISKAIAAGITGDISPTDAMGLASMGFLGNALLSPSTPQAPKSPQQLEAEQVAAQKWAIESARQERAREEVMDASVAPMLALLDPVPSNPSPAMNDKTNYYSKGFEHASQCISQNAGTSCSGAGPDQTACVANYRAGYEAGNKQKEMTMQEAYQAGLEAGKRRELNNGASDERADGSCRTDWIQSYGRGYFAGKSGK